MCSDGVSDSICVSLTQCWDGLSLSPCPTAWILVGVPVTVPSPAPGLLAGWGDCVGWKWELCVAGRHDVSEQGGAFSCLTTAGSLTSEVSLQVPCFSSHPSATPAFLSLDWVVSVTGCSISFAKAYSFLLLVSYGIKLCIEPCVMGRG